MKSDRLRELLGEFSALSKHFDAGDLRWSYLIIAALVPIGIGANIWLIHGWTVWPFVAVIALMVIVNESVDRNAQGFPPLQVYAFFIGALSVYAIVLTIISALNVLVLLAAMLGIFYYAGKAYMKQRQSDRLIAQRLLDGECVFCGHPANAEMAQCENCGEEPASAQRSRISAVMNNNRASDRMRAVLAKKGAGDVSRGKESALIARSAHRKRSSAQKR